MWVSPWLRLSTVNRDNDVDDDCVCKCVNGYAHMCVCMFVFECMCVPVLSQQKCARSATARSQLVLIIAACANSKMQSTPSPPILFTYTHSNAFNTSMKISNRCTRMKMLSLLCVLCLNDRACIYVHSSRLVRCVLKMDHHCMWFWGCVGLHNYRLNQHCALHWRVIAHRKNEVDQNKSPAVALKFVNSFVNSVVILGISIFFCSGYKLVSWIVCISFTLTFFSID